MRPSPLRSFHPLIRLWFTTRFGAPTDIQEKSWATISCGEHVLLTVPTGSGKTLAAFLWAINQLTVGTWSTGLVRVLLDEIHAVPTEKRGTHLITAVGFGPLRCCQRRYDMAGPPYMKGVVTPAIDPAILLIALFIVFDYHSLISMKVAAKHWLRHAGKRAFIDRKAGFMGQPSLLVSIHCEPSPLPCHCS